MAPWPTQVAGCMLDSVCRCITPGVAAAEPGNMCRKRQRIPVTSSGEQWTSQQMWIGVRVKSGAQVSAVECGPYDYSRSGNPTRAQLEAHMAELEVRCAE